MKKKLLFCLLTFSIAAAGFGQNTTESELKSKNLDIWQTKTNNQNQIPDRVIQTSYGHISQKSSRASSDVQSRMTGYAFSFYDGNDYIMSDTVKYFWEGDRNQINLDTVMIGRIGAPFPFSQLNDPLYYHGTGNAVRVDSTVGVYSNGIYHDKRTFDINGFPTSYELQQSIASDMVNIEKLTYQYDDQGNCLETIQLAPQGNSDWDNVMKWQYTYDDQNNLIHWNVQTWETQEAQWIDYSKFTLEYDNGLCQSEVRQGWTGTQWMNTTLYERSYDNNANLTSYTTKTWENNDWVNYSNFNYEYDASNNMTSHVYQEWDGNEWFDITIYGYMYEDNVLTSSTWDWLDENTGSVEQFFHFDYQYNDYGQCTRLYSTTWDGSQYVPTAGTDAQLDMYYEEFVPTVIKEFVAENEILLYPNPASDHLNVKLNNFQINQISIVDMTGRVVFQTNGIFGATEVSIPVDQLSGGIYILHVTSEAKTGAKSFVVSR